MSQRLVPGIIHVFAISNKILTAVLANVAINQTVPATGVENGRLVTIQPSSRLVKSIP